MGIRHSFAFKLGLLVTLLTVGVASVALWIFYSFSRQAILEEMQGRLRDVTHTGSFLLREEERQLILEMKDFILEHTYPRTPEFLDIPTGETKESLPPELAEEFMASAPFQHLVQILRRIQRGSSSKVDGLKSLKQDGGTGPQPPNIFWAYLMVPVPEVEGHRLMMFLADSNYEQIDYNGDGEIEGPESGNPIGNFYAGDYEIFGKPYDTGEIVISPGWYSDKWGTFMTAVVPIKDVNGKVIATLGLDYLVTLQSQRLDQILQICIWVFAGSLVLAILFSILLAYLINKPITRLRRGAERIGKRDYSARINVRSADEFGLLAETLNSMAVEIRDYQSGLERLVDERTRALGDAHAEIQKLFEALKRENESLGAELDVARRLQINLLPKPAELETLPGIDVAYISDPAPQVGGDYFDIIQGERGSIRIGIGDVSGHGLESGLYMLMMRTAVRTLFADDLIDITGCYTRVNQVAYRQSQQSGTRPYMTLSLMDYDGKSSYTLTGQHEDVIVLRDADTLEVVDTQNLGMPVGLVPDIKPFVDQLRVRLAPGQVLLLHTNGLTDVQNAEGERFGFDRLCAVAKAQFGQSAERIRDRILAAVRAFAGEQPIPDDLTLVVIRQKG